MEVTLSLNTRANIPMNSTIKNEDSLMFAPYSLEPMNSAPTVRAYNMYHALKKKLSIDLVSGGFNKRTLKEIGYLFKNKKTTLLYIEALASPLSKIDYVFLNNLKRRGARIFPFIRDLYWKFPETLSTTDPYRRRWLDNWYKKCEKEIDWYLNNASGLFFPSKRMAELIDFPEKHVLRPGGAPSRVSSRELPQDKNVVFIGALSERTGVCTLLESMEYLHNRHPDARCIIMGSGDKSIIEKWRKRGWVAFRIASYWDMPNIMSDVYIAAIPWSASFVHNNLTIPLKLFDYMSFGRPIVATNCKVMAQFIKKNKIGVITNDDPRSFADGLAKLMDDRNLACKMGMNAIRAIENKHSWEHRAEKLVQIMARSV